jgi:hypothetical protein
MTRSCLSRVFLNVVTVATLALATNVQAAILTLDGVQRITTLVPTPVNLTTVGSLDWAYWAPITGTGVAPLVPPTNEKTSGTAIGGLDTVGGGSLRGSTTASTVERYSWSDGTSPATGTNASLAGLIFNSQIGTSAAGKGWKLTIAGDPAVERVVTLYLGGFSATGNLVLTLNGVAAPLTDTKTFTSANPKQMDVYTLRFQPDALSDLLTVEYTASAITDPTNGHVGLQAVAVGLAVPEPGGAGLLFLGSLALCRRRRA